MKIKNYILSVSIGGILLALAGCATAPRQTNSSVSQLIPLKLFWNGRDNYTVASAQGEKDAQTRGYQFVRVEGYVFADPQSGTVPLKQYWSAKKHDFWLLAKPMSKAVEINNAYKFVRIEGYAYSNAQPGTVQLKRFLIRGDNFTLATSQGEKDALAAGYIFRRIEAYVIPIRENLRRRVATNFINVSVTNKVEIVSAGQIQNWIAQLGDADFSKRETAIAQLAQHPAEALPALQQALAATTDNDRRWWIQSAIQECQK